MRRTTVFMAVAASVVLAHAVSAASLPEATPGEAGVSAQRLQRVTALMSRYVEEGKVAGSVTLVARRGKVIHLEPVGWRDRETKSPMREDTIFRIASQTKAITSVAALMLQEDGKLLLTDPVSKYLPEYATTTVAVKKDAGQYDIVPAARPITVRDLMLHTAGIPYPGGIADDRWQAAGITDAMLAGRDEPIRDTVRRFAALPFDSQPGAAFIYGFNTDVLGAVVEQAAGMSLDAFLRTRIFEPLRMHDTHFYLPQKERDRLAVVYRLSEGKLQRLPEGSELETQGSFVDGPRRNFSGGGGLLSTVGDYARFLQMLLNGGELDGAHILSRKSVELMTANQLGGVEYTPGEGFGLGVGIVTDLGVRGLLGSKGEYGWGGTYHTEYWVDPQEELIVVTMCQLRGEVDDQQKLRVLIYQALDE